MKKSIVIFVSFLLIFSGVLTPWESKATTSTLVDFTVNVWADNWFALYVNGKKVAEDPVSIKTTKSFNKLIVNFKATYPLVIGLVGKDYVENKSGLEYIGTPQQQIGDAGLIAEVIETKSKKLVTWTSSAWKVNVLNTAPTNPECVASLHPELDCKYINNSLPKNWASISYNAAKWQAAKEFTEAQVQPKDGYFEVQWSSLARLIWSSSLTLDNVVLFRTKVYKSPVEKLASQSFTVESPGLGPGNLLSVDNTCDGKGVNPQITWSSPPKGTGSFALIMDSAPGPARPGENNSGDFTHWALFNIPFDKRSIPISPLEIGSQVKNFKGSLGYTPPCSQGPGLKKYTVHLYAVSGKITAASVTGPELLNLLTPKLLAEAHLDFFYSRN